MEIGDFYVINKADKPEAEASYISTKFVIDSAEINFRDGWKPIVTKTVATKGEGIKELVDMFEEHKSFLESNGIFRRRIVDRRVKMVELIVRRNIDQVLQKTIDENKKEILMMPLLKSVEKIRDDVIAKISK